MNYYFLIFSFFFQISTYADEVHDNHIDKIEEKIILQIRANSIPGCALAVVENGKVVMLKGYGFANVERQIPVSTQTIFELASISKTFSAIGILHLIETERLDLEKPVSTYLTRWKFQTTSFDLDKITIKTLLNHTAGLLPVHYIGTTSLDKLSNLTDSLNGINRRDEKLVVSYQPETSFHYTGAGYTLLQLIVEEVTGLSFHEYMQNEIFAQIGLTRSTFNPRFSHTEFLASSYNLFGREIDQHFYIEQAAAGLYSSIEDLAMFITYILNIYHLPNEDSKKNVIKPDSLKSMMAINQNNYAFGFETEQLNPDLLLAFHTGDNYGTRSGLFLLPQQSDGLAIIVNSDKGLELVEEIGSIWLESRTGGFSLSFYNEMQQLTHWINGICLILTLLLGYLSLNSMKYLKKSTRKITTIKGMLKIAGWLFLMGGWAAIFYTPYSFYPGLYIATFLPSNLIYITTIIIIFGLINIVTTLTSFVSNFLGKT